MSLNIQLREFEPVDNHIPKGSETMKQLCELLAVPESGCIDEFCRELQKRVDLSSAKDIYLLNQSADTSPKLFSKLGSVQWTQGYVGVLQFSIPWKKEPKKDPEQVTVEICSRFDKGRESHFLMYVFEKTFGTRGKLYDEMRIPGYATKTWDLLLTATFVQHLHDALKKGMFRQYKEYERNDDRLSGRIDIARHLKQNMLFSGRIAYTSREYTVDNPINTLILRAFDRLDRDHHALLRNLIAKDDVVKQGIQLLKAEVLDWQKPSEDTVLRDAERKIAQSVYRNYEPLRKTSIAVLKRMGVNAFVRSESTITGMLIDMPKLWEEFLYNTIFKEYTGASGKYQQERYPILGGARFAEPDFLLREQSLVLDAKYKSGWGDSLTGDWSKLRNDVYQIISYALIFNCRFCGVVFPVSEDAAPDEALLSVPIGQQCSDTCFLRIPYVIPQNTFDGDAYRQAFAESDQRIINTLQKLKRQVSSV